MNILADGKRCAKDASRGKRLSGKHQTVKGEGGATKTPSTEKKKNQHANAKKGGKDQNNMERLKEEARNALRVGAIEDKEETTPIAIDSGNQVGPGDT